MGGAAGAAKGRPAPSRPPARTREDEEVARLQEHPPQARSRRRRREAVKVEARRGTGRGGRRGGGSSGASSGGDSQAEPSVKGLGSRRQRCNGGDDGAVRRLTGRLRCKGRVRREGERVGGREACDDWHLAHVGGLAQAHVGSNGHELAPVERPGGPRDGTRDGRVHGCGARGGGWSGGWGGGWSGSSGLFLDTGFFGWRRLCETLVGQGKIASRAVASTVVKLEQCARRKASTSCSSRQLGEVGFPAVSRRMLFLDAADGGKNKQGKE